MAKPTGALLAFDARGQIGKTLVYASWRGRGYARRYVIPANPRSAEQTLTRTAFSWLTQVWKMGPAIFQGPWTLYATGQVFTDRNALNAKNVSTLRSATDLSGMVMTPGAKGGVALTNATFTAGNDLITVAGTTPTPPTGWTVTAVQACCIRDQDPNTGVLYTITAGEDTSSPYSFDLTGLTGGVLYYCAAWIKWLKPDGTVAYGPQFSGSATPT